MSLDHIEALQAEAMVEPFRQVSETLTRLKITIIYLNQWIYCRKHFSFDKVETNIFTLYLQVLHGHYLMLIYVMRKIICHMNFI